MSEETAQGDFQKMQQQAIDRVREMQKKATPDHQPNPGSQPRPSRFFPPGDKRTDRQTFPNQQREQPHTQHKPTEEQRPQPERGKEETPPKNQLFSGMNPLSSLLNMDTDMSLILPLVMLLGKEGADDMLLLALIYIMT